jgi:hypothetical protein
MDRPEVDGQPEAAALARRADHALLVDPPP